MERLGKLISSTPSLGRVSKEPPVNASFSSSDSSFVFPYFIVRLLPEPSTGDSAHIFENVAVSSMKELVDAIKQKFEINDAATLSATGRKVTDLNQVNEVIERGGYVFFLSIQR